MSHLAYGLVFGGPLLLFLVLAAQVSEEGGPAWDPGLARLLARLGDALAPARSGRFFDYSPTLGAVGLIGFVLALAVRRRIRDAVFVAVAVAGVVCLDPLLKQIFERPAPGDTSGFSFPSGSAMASMAGMIAIAVLAWPTRARWPVMLGGAALVLVYGVAIVDAGWHYPSDVLAGWCVGIMWVGMLWLFGRGARRFRDGSQDQ